MPAGMSIAVVIPAYNEEPVIGRMLAAIPRESVQQIIVADNGSTDRTSAVAEAAGATVVRTDERGYGAACLAAMEAVAEGIEVVVFLQADLSEDPREIAALVAPITAGEADLVIGSRAGARVEPGALLPHQRFGNRLAVALIGLLHGHRFTDLGPFRAIRRTVLERLGMRERGYGWTAEMQVRAVRAGLRIREAPVSYAKRAGGTNKISGRPLASAAAGVRIIWTILRLSAAGLFASRGRIR
jgi:glycosyltransferase involved in cell wall biosynthesis